MVWLTIQLVSLLCIEYVISVTVDSCDSPIYCKGDLLHTIQYTVKVFEDSKTFVDLSQINSPEDTLAHFKSLMTKTNNTPSIEDVQQFLKENFKEEGELDEWTPPDFNPNPAFLNKIQDSSTRNFAKQLVGIWPSLGRKVNANVSTYSDRHSLIPLPNGFIVPGGRFKEIYYWDSYFVIKGLIISEMTETARGMIENLLSLVKRYGFIPNGSRVYYLNRSQPPLMTRMVKLYFDATNNIAWLKDVIGTLEQELNWWQENRMVSVQKDGTTYKMARYAVESNTPRPESYWEDIETCAYYQTDAEKETCYQNLKSGAESGWDFSSRWIVDENKTVGTKLALIKTLQIIPVDLNSFLCGAQKEIARFYDILGDNKAAIEWWARAEVLQKAIEAVLYDNTDGIWYDYDMISQTSRKQFFPSNFAPLWAESYNTYFRKSYGARAAKYFEREINETAFMGGIPSSLTNANEQWDFPNAWPPLQEIAIIGLDATEDHKAQEIAREYSMRWVQSNQLGFLQTGKMFEKYDSVIPGHSGGGGEYTVQTGFGWSNGVVLSFLDAHPDIAGTSAGTKPSLSVMFALIVPLLIWTYL